MRSASRHCALMCTGKCAAVKQPIKVKDRADAASHNMNPPGEEQVRSCFLSFSAAPGPLVSGRFGVHALTLAAMPTDPSPNASLLAEERFMNFSPARTVDIFDRAPKPISPQVHRWLDVAVTSAFAVMGGIFLGRGRGRAATAAFLNAGMVAGVSMFTDYDGDGVKPISFKMHGFMDIMQAATAGTAPLTFGFAGDREAAFFYSQAGSEVGVVAMTDWDAGDRNARRLDFAA